ncbi:Na+/H+ antiporter, partial [Candidatus Roizmanbacteria bacterium]|nr:Na+/H+ antiporter [Candidatus Roizmanbacteria bacterium]
YVFILFLPLLLMEAAYYTSLRDFKNNMRPISQLAIGLVIATTFAAAAILKWLVPGIGWAAAIAFGAIISPPDAVAATAITRRLKVPKRIITILSGESLVNDATGLVVYKFAVLAVVAGSFSMLNASISFVWVIVAGSLVGYFTTVLYLRLYPYIKDHTIEIISTFIVPYAAYLIAESFGASGILAVVVAGLKLSWESPNIFAPESRIRTTAVWEVMTFALNGFVFILIGLQFPSLMSRLAHYSIWTLVGYAAAVCMVIIILRIVWVFVVGYGTRFLFPSIRKRDPYPPWQNVFIIGWTGMRGVVSLAAALALPYITNLGTPFPERDLLIFLAFSVILGTLVLQGLSLPWVIRRMKLFIDTENLYEAWNARKQAVLAVLAKLDQVCTAQNVPESVVQRLHAHYTDRLEELGDGPNTRLDTNDSEPENKETTMAAERRLWHDLIAVERNVIITLRKASEISDEVMRDIEQELDLMHARFERTTIS